MKRWFPAALAALGGLGPWAAACSAQHGSPGAQGTYDASEADTSSPTTEGGGDAAADDDASPTQTYLRIAHVSPDMPPIDVCVALHGTGSYQGPLIGQLAATNAGDAGEDAEGGGADGDAGLPGVSYAQVSAYLPLDPGDYDVRIVAAGASSCDASTDGGAAVPDSTNLPALTLAGYATLLVAGELSPFGTEPGINVGVLPDDAVLSGGAASLRAINAIPSQPSLDFGMGSSTTQWLAFVTDVHFAAASAQVNPDDGAVDPNGYVGIAPLSDQAMSARSSSSDAATDVAAASSVTIPLGSIATVIAIGGKTGDSTHPPALLLCTDNQPSGGTLADCSIAQ
jgi:hypothetical protein